MFLYFWNNAAWEFSNCSSTLSARFRCGKIEDALYMWIAVVLSGNIFVFTGNCWFGNLCNCWTISLTPPRKWTKSCVRTVFCTRRDHPFVTKSACEHFQENVDVRNQEKSFRTLNDSGWTVNTPESWALYRWVFLLGFTSKGNMVYCIPVVFSVLILQMSNALQILLRTSDNTIRLQCFYGLDKKLR